MNDILTVTLDLILRASGYTTVFFDVTGTEPGISQTLKDLLGSRKIPCFEGFAQGYKRGAPYAYPCYVDELWYAPEEDTERIANHVGKIIAAIARPIARKKKSASSTASR